MHHSTALSTIFCLNHWLLLISRTHSDFCFWPNLHCAVCALIRLADYLLFNVTFCNILQKVDAFSILIQHPFTNSVLRDAVPGSFFKGGNE